MAPSIPPSDTMIQMPSQTNDRAPPAMPAKGADDVSTTAMAADRTVVDKVMSSAANLAQLLPTGTVLAYEALSPSFTNHGACHLPANKWLSATLVAVMAVFSVLFSFTDSVVGRDSRLYYGVATPHGFNVFNFSGDEEEREWALGELQKLRLRPMDYVHAVVAAVVFLTVAFSDTGLQRCFFPNTSDNTSELLKNLPLGMSFLSSFVYMIFPDKAEGHWIQRYISQKGMKPSHSKFRSEIRHIYS